MKVWRVWKGCEGYVCSGIPPLRLTLSQVEGQSVVQEMEVTEVQRLDGIGKVERSETTKRVNATEEELRSASRARV